MGRNELACLFSHFPQQEKINGTASNEITLNCAYLNKYLHHKRQELLISLLPPISVGRQSTAKLSAQALILLTKKQQFVMFNTNLSLPRYGRYSSSSSSENASEQQSARQPAQQQYAHPARAIHHPHRSYVAPNRTTNPMGSWPCEKMAAYIEATTEDYKRIGDVESICSRLLQTKRQQRMFKTMAAVEAICVFAQLYMAFTSNNDPQSRFTHGVIAAAGILTAIPHIGVAKQLSRVHQRCREYLKERYGQDFLDSLDGLRMGKKGLTAVINLLVSKDPGISTLKLEEKLEDVMEKESSLAGKIWLLIEHLQEMVNP